MIGKRALEADEYELAPFAEVGQALINISKGADFWGAFAQATANTSRTTKATI